MRFILLLIAAVIAVVAGVVALQMSNKAAPVPGQPVPQQTISLTPNVSTVEVLVAKTYVPVGTVITAEMVDKQPWPENLLVEGFVVAGRGDDQIVGKVARGSYQVREPFMGAKLANPNDPSFLAAELPSGMRAVTIATDAVAGVAGFIFPGDRVDVLLTHNVPEEIRTAELRAKGETDAAGTAPATRPAISEVLVANARVLAVNVREIGGQGQPQPTATPSSMTLEVSDSQVQQLRLAEKLGTLSLDLRSLKDRDSDEVPDPTGVTQLTRVRLVEDKNQEAVKVVRGVNGGAGDTAGANVAKALSTIFTPKQNQ